MCGEELPFFELAELGMKLAGLVDLAQSELADDDGCAEPEHRLVQRAGNVGEVLLVRLQLRPTRQPLRDDTRSHGSDPVDGAVLQADQHNRDPERVRFEACEGASAQAG